MINKITNLKGENGGIYESGTTAITGNFDAILALEATVLASATISNIAGDSFASMPIPAGVIIYGKITAFTLTSGKVIAYNAV